MAQDDTSWQQAFLNQTPEQSAPVQQTPAPAPQQTLPTQVPSTPVQPTQPTQDEWRSYASTLGYDVAEATNPREAIERIHRQAQEAAQRSAQQAYQQAYYQQPQQPEPTPAPEPDYWSTVWKSPQFDQSWMNVLERDPDTGQFVPKTTSTGIPIARPEIVQQANEWLDWYQSAPREFFANPYKKTYDALKDPILKEVRTVVEEIIQSTNQKREREQAVSSFEKENFNKLYVVDQTGGAQLDVHGQRVLTPYGSALVANMRSLVDAGMPPDSPNLIPLAQKLMPPEETPAAPASSKGSVKEDLSQQTFLASALERAKNGNSYGGFATPTPADTEVSDEGEINNVFIHAAQRAAAIN